MKTSYVKFKNKIKLKKKRKENKLKIGQIYEMIAFKALDLRQ